MDVFRRFCEIFRGNTSFYTIHVPPFTSSEAGKMKAKFNGFAVYGSKSFPKIPPDKEKGDLVSVTQETYQDHLNGKAGLALAPITDGEGEKNVCWYGAIDIDVIENLSWLAAKLYEAKLKFAMFRSKSGGAHIYFFFERAERADRVIAALETAKAAW